MSIINELIDAGAKFAETFPVIAKWGPAIDALVETLESGRLSQDDFVKSMKATMLNASDAEMHRELG